MENASKALIMAGEILIGIIVLGILAFVIVSFGRYSSDMHKRIANQEVYKFNSNFLSYSGRVDITSQEIATIINFAKRENDNNNLSRNNSENNEAYIDIIIDNKSFFKDNKYIKKDSDYDIATSFNKCVNEFIRNNNLKYFRCQANVKKITNVNGVLEIETDDKYNDNDDIGYNTFNKINKIVFQSVDESKYNVTSSIVINPYKGN